MTMPPFEMRMRVRHDCPFCRISSRYPEVTIKVWCNTHTHILELHGGDEEDLEAMERESVLVGNSHMAFKERGGLRIISKECDCGPNDVTTLVNLMNCWYLEPLIVNGGWEDYRVFAYSRESLSALVDEIRSRGGEVSIISLKQLGMLGMCELLLPGSSILADMTEKQLRALSEAFAWGYFEEPSRVSADRLARAMGVSRSTFSEHLRKAQKKLMMNVFPVLQMAVVEESMAPSRSLSAR